MIKAQKTLIIVIAALIAALAVAYFAVVKPMVNKVDEVTTEPLETVEGEIAGANGRYQLFEQVARADMKSIEVTNEHGTFKFVRSEDDSFVIEGAEDTLYSAELFSQLVVDCGYTLAKTKIGNNITEDLYKYGLDEASSPASFTVTTLTGKTHKVFVGNRITTGGGYYARYDGRDSVYVLDTTLAATVLRPIENYVTPLLSYPTSMNTYFLIENFTVFHGEEVFASFTYLEEDERNPIHTYSAFAMLYPGEGTYCPSGYLDSALQAFVNFEGSEVVKLAPKDEDLSRYFPDGYPYTVYIVNNIPKDTSDYTKGYTPVENMLLFSELHEDKEGNPYYYCFSPRFNIIAKVNDYTASFLQWDLKMWVNDTIYQLQIDTVEEIKFVLPDNQTVTFLLDGLGQDLVVTVKETGFKPMVKNFRQLYKMILSVNKESTHNMTDDELKALLADESSRQLTMTVKMRNGTVLEYDCNNYSDRRTYYSINDVKCDFYVLRTMVKKLGEDVIRVTKDETVNSEDKY
ncbi:MAG: DUF4340 domain-containing protein [Ruminococcaceae bacterium]|nr:DUF4340 domain-containing protein [Oscillospiraceae bacterium]